MKGMIFKVFENHVTRHFGQNMLDELLDEPGLSTGGSYTSVGNYPYTDLTKIVGSLSERTAIPVRELLHTFGFELFAVLAEGHGAIMARFSSCLGMLAGIEAVIHRDVRKLYSDAELPRFEVEAHQDESNLRLVYKSSRPFVDLAEGLIQGALSHYGVNENATVLREDLSDDGTHARFEIQIGSAWP